MTQFTQPVSMQVTQEQYEKDLKEPLKLLGYIIDDITLFVSYTLLITNYGDRPNNVTNYSFDAKTNKGRYFIDHYNPKLFLAIAAMTNEQYGIRGEHWKCIGKENSNCFTVNKIYTALSSMNEVGCFVDDYSHCNCFFDRNINNFVKATKEELINSFTKKETVINKVDRTISIKCANQEEFSIVKEWLKSNNEEIFSTCAYGGGFYPVIYCITSNSWSSCTEKINSKTPQELGIILNTLLNKPTMQNSLTRVQLLKLHNNFNCTTFRDAIEEILRSNVMAYDSTVFSIHEMHIKALIKDGTPAQKEAVSKLGIVLIEDKSVDTKNTLIGSMIGKRDCGEYQNKAFYLSYEYIWEIKKDIQGLLCLIPTKK